MDNSRTRHLSLVPSTPRASADTGGNATDQRGPGHESAPRDPVSPGEDMVVSGQGRCGSYTIRAHGTANFELVVPGLAQPPLAAPPGPSKKTQATAAALAQVTLALHPFAGGRMERPGGALLRWPADDVRLGRTRRQRRPTVAGATDASSGDRVPALRLLRLLARRAVAQYVAALSCVSLIGPTKTW